MLAVVIALAFVTAQAVPEWIAAAIAHGQRTKQYMALEVAGSVRFGVYLRGPYARVASASARQARKYLTLDPAAVTEDMRSPLLEVTIVPAAPEPGYLHWLPEHVVIKHANGTVYQPERLDREEMAWGNAFGGEWNGHTLIAWFDYAAIPPGDLDIVTISKGKEFRANVKTKHRSLIR